MKRITFGSTDAEKTTFALMYRAFNLGGEVKGPEQNALASSIIKKLEVLNVSGEEGIAKLTDEGGNLDLTEREMEMFRRHIEGAAFPPTLAPKMEIVYERIAGAEKVPDEATSRPELVAAESQQ